MRFCLVGSSVAAIDFSLVWLFSHWLRPLVAVSLAYLIGVCCHFIFNKIWVFQCPRKDYIIQLFQYSLVVLASWLTTLIAVQLSLLYLTQNILIAKLFALPFATLVAFFLMRLLVFRAPEKLPIT
jgi:putative flippase GtrA